ncbi:hypothetical protein ACLMJK_004992 [Lecanora helva]
MPPKPFPLPIGVGIDICRIHRIAALLQNENSRNQWARRVFTRMEWPSLCMSFNRANDSGKWESDSITKENYISDVYLPRLSNHSDVLRNSELYWSAINDKRSKLAGLAQHLAGRWAAKEAVIKAHRHRRLFMQEISIVRPPGQVDEDGGPIALVDPVCNTIEMNEHVAALRGLGRFTSKSLGYGKSLVSGKHDDSESVQGQKGKDAIFERRHRIQESDRQCVEVSISHDGAYATAICIGFDSPETNSPALRITDDGSGPPIHEPQWGDEGFLQQGT